MSFSYRWPVGGWLLLASLFLLLLVFLQNMYSLQLERGVFMEENSSDLCWPWELLALLLIWIDRERRGKAVRRLCSTCRCSPVSLRVESLPCLWIRLTVSRWPILQSNVCRVVCTLQRCNRVVEINFPCTSEKGTNRGVRRRKKYCHRTILLGLRKVSLPLPQSNLHFPHSAEMQSTTRLPVPESLGMWKVSRCSVWSDYAPHSFISAWGNDFSVWVSAGVCICQTDLGKQTRSVWGRKHSNAKHCLLVLQHCLVASTTEVVVKQRIINVQLKRTPLGPHTNNLGSKNTICWVFKANASDNRWSVFMYSAITPTSIR